MAALRTAFTKKPMNQSSSSLLQLPAELRIKILRNLMKAEEVVVSSATDKLLGTERVASQYSAQVLRTCQQLLHEGHPLLYDGKTLAVKAHFRGGRYHLRFLDATLEVPRDLLEITESDDELLGKDGRANVSAPPCTKEYYRQRLSAALPAIENFQRIQLILDTDSQVVVFMTCWMLCKVLAGKDVTIAAPNIGFRGNLIRRRINDRRDPEFLQSCKLFNCRTVTFKRFEVPDDLPIFIMSGQTIRQNLRPFQHLHQKILARLPKLGVDQFYLMEAVDLLELERALISFEMEKYYELQKAILHKVAWWNNIWTETEGEDLVGQAFGLRRRGRKGEADVLEDLADRIWRHATQMHEGLNKAIEQDQRDLDFEYLAFKDK